MDSTYIYSSICFHTIYLYLLKIIDVKLPKKNQIFLLVLKNKNSIGGIVQEHPKLP